MTTAWARASWVLGNRMCHKIGRHNIPMEPTRFGAAAASRIERLCRAAHRGRLAARASRAALTLPTFV
jgi:hypothetical protein